MPYLYVCFIGNILFMKRYLAFFLFSLIGYGAQAQNIGGIWLSGSGITGEGTGIHTGETQVLSIEDSIVNTIQSAGGAGIGKIVFSPFRFKKSLNGNSVFLFASAGKGNILPNLVFKFYERKQTGSFVPSLTISLSNVIVTKYKIVSPYGNNASPTSEEISLVFDKIQFTDNAGNTAVVQAGGH
jgi:type VI secretion system Hcp family effector